jgi:hypothetical protein
MNRIDYSQVLLVVCLTLFIVIGINAAIYAALRGGKEVGQIELFRRAARRARRPWGEEDDNLEELSNRVSSMKEKDKE